MIAAGISNISTLILNRWGSIVPSQDRIINRYITEFNNSCPDNARLQRIVYSRNNIITQIQQLNTFITNIQRVVNTIRTIITAINTSITILVTLPIPVQFLTVGNVLTLTQLLDGLNRELERFTQVIDSINYVFDTINESIQQLLDKLRLLDTKIGECGSKVDTNTLNILLNRDNISQRQLDEPIYYNNYRFEIRTDSNNPLSAPLRYAVALNSFGVVVARGESSYSSDTNVLINELILKLNTQ